MQPSSAPARYVTLRDYLRVLRRYRVAIVAIAIIGAVAGAVDAKRQTPVYDATATVQFQDPAQNLSLVGLASSFDEQPAQVAATNAETLTRPQIMDRVRRLLRTSTPAGTLAAAVSGQVSSAGLLEVTAAWSTPEFAQQLATAVAAVVVSEANQAARAQFATAVADIRSQLSARRAQRHSAGNAAQIASFENELAPLQTLSRLAQSGQVVEAASTPSAPSSPHTTRSALLGLVLGLLLAIALAFVRDSMDRRLRGRDEIERSYQLPVIGHVRSQAMGEVVSSPSPSDDRALDLEAFRIIRRNIASLDDASPPRSIVVTSAVADEGKTTVASSLAFAIATTGKKTLLIDCDLRRPSLAKRLGIPSSPGLTDFLTGHAEPGDVLRVVGPRDAAPGNGNGNGASTSVGRPIGGLVCIPAGSPTQHAAELLGSARFSQFLDEVRQAYDVVVIDSSPLLPVVDTLEMLPRVDCVVICARQSRTTHEQADAVRTALSRGTAHAAGVVVTGLDVRSDDYQVYTYTTE